MSKVSRNEVEMARIKGRARLVDLLFTLTARFVDKLPFLVFIVCSYLSIREIAGKNTSFNAVGKVFMSLSANQWFAWIVAGLCGIGYYNERRLRKKTIKEHEGYIRELETRSDPKRKSSGLMESGQPRPEDKHVI